MGHHHHHHHHHHSAQGNIAFALVLNGCFTVVEFIGGYLTGSVAITADALHDLGDTLTLGLAYGLERYAGKRSDANFSYGYRRMSLLSAMITGAVLVAGSAIILGQAIPRLFAPSMPHIGGMLWLAVLGVAVNGFAAWRVWNGTTMNERVITWHMLEDLFGWIAVMLTAVAMAIFEMPILDPIFSIGFTCFILVGVFRNVGQTLRLFLQGVPDSIDIEALEKAAIAIDGIEDVHDIHIWSLDGDHHVMTMHAVIGDDLAMPRLLQIKTKVREVLADFGKFHLTIEFESKAEDCPDASCSPVVKSIEPV